jgi:hypothetical protein
MRNRSFFAHGKQYRQRISIDEGIKTEVKKGIQNGVDLLFQWFSSEFWKKKKEKRFSDRLEKIDGVIQSCSGFQNPETNCEVNGH